MSFIIKNVRVLSSFTIIVIVLSFFIFRNSGPKHNAEVKEQDSIKKEIVLSPFDSLVIDFKQKVNEGLDSGFIPGIAYCIVKNDSIVALGTGGLKEYGTNDSINTNTVFRLASVSKGFASFLTALYVKDSIIRYDDKVKTYIPELELKDSSNTVDLQVLHVLDHTSGLVPHAYDDLVESNVDFNEILENLRYVDICCGVGQTYGYQNVVYSLSGKILENIENKSYSEILKEKVFDPLKMKDASADFLSMSSDSNIALPHGYTGKGWNKLQLKNTYYTVAPAAGVNASISDMAIWLKTLLGNKPKIIDTASLNFMFQEQIYTPLKRAYTRNWKNVTGRYYGLGWRIFEISKKEKVIYHGGYVRGYRADIAFCPKKKIGIVVLMNGASQYGGELVPEFYNDFFALQNSK